MILEELKNQNRWIVWRYEDRPNIEKPAKVHYNPNSNKFICGCLKNPVSTEII